MESEEKSHGCVCGVKVGNDLVFASMSETDSYNLMRRFEIDWSCGEGSGCELFDSCDCESRVTARTWF